MVKTSTLKTNSIRFGSSMANILVLNHFIEDICDHYNIFNRYFGNILTAVTEAVQNAIVHGNQGNPGKWVTVSFASRSDGLCFTVSDEGSGFDVESLPDPTDISNDGLSGRGIFLMKSLSDEINFFDNGCTVELFFNITGIDEELAYNRVEQLASYFQGVKTPTE